MALKFRLYDGGSLQFKDPRVTKPVTFAHVSDLHMVPASKELWPKRYRGAIDWWAQEMKQPHTVIASVLDEIQAADVDFVFFGGDMLDYYRPESAEHLASLCRERGLKCYYQIGNHDWETDHIRYVTHALDDKARAENCAKLTEHWDMPGLYYSFDMGGIRFIALDTPYDRVGDAWGATFDHVQADWFDEQLAFDGPIVVFHHVPFVVPTFEARLRAFWMGGLAGVIEDEAATRILNGIQQNPNVLGSFVGHAHMRSENPIGDNWQFMVEPAYHRSWRYVKIDATTPPKSQRVPDTAEIWMQRQK
jgi:predicted MPP superfamily phosphohydrolase